MANNITREALLHNVSNGKVSTGEAAALFNTLDKAGVKVDKSGNANELYASLFGGTKETRKEWKSSDQVYDFWHAEIYDDLREAQEEIDLTKMVGEYGTLEQELEAELKEAFEILEKAAPWR